MKLHQSMVDPSEALHARIRRYSRGVDPGESAAAECVILVPPHSLYQDFGLEGAPLGQGFIEARRRLREGTNVRLIADGATVVGSWPEWVPACPNLTLTELGAYRADDLVLGSRPLAADVRAWLDSTFEGVIPGISSASLLYSSAASRFLQPLFDAALYVDNLARAHPEAVFHCVAPKWVGLPALNDRLRSTGGRAEPLPAEPAWTWSARVVIAMAYWLLRAVGGQLRNYWRAAPSRARLRALRARPLDAPAVWVVLVPDWERINRHTIEAAALPALDRGVSLGILLCTTLLPTERRDQAMHTRLKSRLWPGLGDLEARLDAVSVEQVVAPESLRDLATVIREGAARCLTIALRLARQPPILCFGSLKLDLSKHLPALAALAATDVLQAVSAAHAVRRLRAMHEVDGSPVIFSSLNQVDTATPNALLRQDGAITVEFVHGSGGNLWYGMSENDACYRAVWTEADAQTCRHLGVRPITVSAPSAVARERPASRHARNLLILTNYVHGDTAQSGLPFEPFQIELLGIVPLIERKFPNRFCIRWRPHPNDDAAAIARAHSRLPTIHLSQQTDLQQDLSEADIVIASPSSTIVQALQAGLPTFVHTPPAARGSPEILAIDPERRFFYARDFIEPFGSFLAALDAGSDQAMAPERAARSTLLGSPDAAKPGLLEQLESQGAFQTG